MVEPRGGGSERQSQSGSLERSLTLTSAAAEALIAETIRAEEEDLKEVYDDLAYRELAKDEVVDRKMKVSSAPSGRLDALKRQHSMQFDKTMDLNRAQKLWMLLDDPSFSSASFYYANFSMLIILISTISFCLESEFNCMNVDLHPHLLNYTLPNGQLACDEWEKTWWWFECLAVVFFTAELTLRFTACPSKGKFMKDFANWIDLLAILPFYLEQVCKPYIPHTAHSASPCTSAPLHPARRHTCALCARHLPPPPRAGRWRRALRLLSLPCDPAGALRTWAPAPHAPYAPRAPRYGTTAPRPSAPNKDAGGARAPRLRHAPLLCTSARLHDCTAARLHLCTSAPLHSMHHTLGTSAPMHPCTHAHLHPLLLHSSCTLPAGACLPRVQDGQELRWVAAHGERVACLEAGALGTLCTLTRPLCASGTLHASFGTLCTLCTLCTSTSRPCASAPLHHRVSAP